MISQFARYLIVGIVNTLVGLGIIFAAKAFINFGDVAANATGYAVGLIIGFVLNRSWTFSHKGEIFASVYRYIGVFAVAYFLNLGTVLFLIDWAQINAYLAQAAGVFCYTIVFFILSKYFVFSNASEHNGQTKLSDTREP
ncbi:MAG: GtrA family protein [Rhodospirillales bacterium]|nr:GtrA family protein [Rhodospirillales bacterium]